MKWLMLKMASAANNAARASSFARNMSMNVPAKRAANGNHSEQATLRKYIQQCAMGFERSWKRLVIGDVRLLEMRAWPQPERSGFQPSTECIFPELQSQGRGALRCLAATVLGQTDCQTFKLIGGRNGIRC